ncbi:MAG: zinc ABC transporter substrate-binding protein [Candidatus Hydrogenedentes bacterium]|nr:zinc ABC transporter substrate-binding protein [Candidatus Hydrogenedentota bacterium]
MRLIMAAFFLAVLGAACGPLQESASERHVVSTIAPLSAILRELAGERFEVHTLLAPGASPHTYEPRPSDAQLVESALALFYVAENLDGWAARLPAKTRVRVLDMLPEEKRLHWEEAQPHGHEHGHESEEGEWDPHFWSDPATVKAILPALAAKMSERDPEGAGEFAAQAERFGAELDALDAEVTEKMSPLKGRPVVMFHPSWNYFLARYGLRLVGLVETAPGKEASPQYLADLVETLRKENVTVIFTEPQLARRPAEVVSEAGNVSLYELDPIGGVPGKMTYRELIIANASVLREALQ